MQLGVMELLKKLSSNVRRAVGVQRLIVSLTLYYWYRPPEFEAKAEGEVSSIWDSQIYNNGISSNDSDGS